MFRHRVDKSDYRIETAFEVRVQTQALCAADQRSSTVLESLPSTSMADDAEPLPSVIACPDDGMPIWTTKEAGACVLTAVLLKLTRLTTDHDDVAAKVGA